MPFARSECLKAAMELLEEIGRSEGRLSQAQQREAAALAKVIRKLRDEQAEDRAA